MPGAVFTRKWEEEGEEKKAVVSVPLDGSVVRLGRSDACGIADKRVSRKQAEVCMDPATGNVTLTVLGVNPSTHIRDGVSTQVAKGESVVLADQDAISLLPPSFGDYVFTLSLSVATGGVPPTLPSDQILQAAASAASIPPPVAAASQDPPAAVPNNDSGAHAGPSDNGGGAVEAAAPAAPAAPSKFQAFLAQMEEDEEAKKEEGEEEKEEEEEPGIDILFSFDTTGSMYTCLDLIRQKVDEVITKISSNMDVRVAIIAHGDFYDVNKTYLMKSLDFTQDLDEIKTFLSDIEQTNGGDGPECYELVLREAQAFSWGQDRSKALVLIGDDVPHEPSYTDLAIDWRAELQALMDASIKIYAVQANRNKAAAPFYEELAEKSGGFLIHLSELDWIEHMFVALCYRQHSPDKFENYRLDLIWDKKLTHASPLNTLFMEMQNPVVNKLDPTYQGHLTKGWWDPENHDHGTPRYRWLPSSKTWKKDHTGRAGTRKRKRVAGAGAGDDDGAGSGSDTDDGLGGGGKKSKGLGGRKKAKKPVVKIMDPARVDGLVKKVQVQQQLSLWRKDPPPGYGPAIVVGGGANDPIEAMRERLRSVLVFVAATAPAPASASAPAPASAPASAPAASGAGVGATPMDTTTTTAATTTTTTTTNP